MPINDPIEASFHQEFQTEKLSRAIQECNDISLLRDIAMELLYLNQQKSAIAQWTSKRAAEAEIFPNLTSVNLKTKKNR